MGRQTHKPGVKKNNPFEIISKIKESMFTIECPSAPAFTATSIAAFAQETTREEIPPKTAVEVGEQFPWSGGTIDTSITLPDVPNPARSLGQCGISARTI